MKKRIEHMIQRKGSGKWSLCGLNRLQKVMRTKDWNKVTCKNCLKKLKAEEKKA